MPLSSAASMSDYTENSLLLWLKGTTMPAAPTTVYAGLLTTNPADTGTTGGTADGTEASYSGYARQSCALTAVGSASGAPLSDSTGQQVQNTTQLTFPAVVAGPVTVTGVGYYSALTTGNLLFWAALTSSQAYATGSAPIILANGATLGVD